MLGAAMALQWHTVTASSALSHSSMLIAWLRGGLVACGRTLWGMTAGLLFLLAFPLAVVLAPLLWAFERLRGATDDEQAGADLP
jgi:hypothetical protein